MLRLSGEIVTSQAILDHLLVYDHKKLFCSLWEGRLGGAACSLGKVLKTSLSELLKLHLRPSRDFVYHCVSILQHLPGPSEAFW